MKIKKNKNIIKFARNFKGKKVAIECEDLNEAKMLFLNLSLDGWKWATDEPLTKENLVFVSKEKRSCYLLEKNKKLCYGFRSDWEPSGYVFVELKRIVNNKIGEEIFWI